MKKRQPIISNSGFTLTEVAIVMSVMGIILSAIWSASSIAYSNYLSSDLSRELLIIPQNIRNDMSSATYIDDNCSVACSTKVMKQIGVFPSDFISPSPPIAQASVGNAVLYTTKWGYPIWTGVEPSDEYIQQDGQCGQLNQPPCSAGATVVEIDLFNIPFQTCVSTLMTLVNRQSSGLIDITGVGDGWGPIEGGAYWGNPTLPTSLTVANAKKACTSGGGGGFNYLSNTSFLWMWFAPS